MENKPLPEGMSWEKVRMLTFDGTKVMVLLKGEESMREYTFGSPEEMRVQVAAWFEGKAQA